VLEGERGEQTPFGTHGNKRPVIIAQEKGANLQLEERCVCVGGHEHSSSTMEAKPFRITRGRTLNLWRAARPAVISRYTVLPLTLSVVINLTIINNQINDL
jgi:hypothetical protein